MDIELIIAHCENGALWLTVLTVRLFSKCRCHTLMLEENLRPFMMAEMVDFISIDGGKTGCQLQMTTSDIINNDIMSL